MAIQVETSETYVSVLGKELRECPALNDKRVEALNFGVGGYTTAENYLLMRDFVWRYSPDFIVLQGAPGMPDPEEDVSARVIIEDDGRQNIEFELHGYEDVQNTVVQGIYLVFNDQRSQPASSIHE